MSYTIAEQRIEKALEDGATELNLEALDLDMLPPSIQHLSMVKQINLRNNHLRQLPEILTQLTALEVLLLDHNEIFNLPGLAIDLSNLKHLSLVGNRLTRLPEWIGRFRNLEVLNLGSNRIVETFESWDELIELRELYLERNNLSSLPASVSELAQLEILNLGRNKLSALPMSLGSLSKLRVLDASSNELRKLPTSLWSLRQLEKLDLSDNPRLLVPATMRNLSTLRSLDLGSCELNSVPEAVSDLPSLCELNLNSNRITNIPESLGQLTHLRLLDIGDNRVRFLPDTIGLLQSLRVLVLSNNRLLELPETIENLSELSQVYLHDNDALGLPPELLGATLEDVRDGAMPARATDIVRYYIRILRESKKKLNEAKILLVGQGGVGKTSLVKRLLDDTFDAAEGRTDGIEISNWGVPSNCGGEGIRLNVWDFGGQEIMHATHQFFLTKRSLYIVVLDARQGENEGNLHYWLKIIQSFGGASPVLVVVNKCEMHNLDLNETRLKIDFAPNIQGFYWVSCATRAGIQELKTAIADQIHRLPHVFDELPYSFFKVKRAAEKAAEERDFLSIEEYRGLCEVCDVRESEDQDLLLRFLHDLGCLLNFDDPDDPYHLGDTNILNPEWVTNGVYKILMNSDVMRCEGVMNVGNLGDILGDRRRYPKQRQHFIVEIMRKFELCFDFTDTAGPLVLIPELLRVNEPDVGWNIYRSLQFEYHYDVLPGGIIPRFIVRMHLNLTEHPTFWRSGVVLEIDGCRTLVRGDLQNSKVFVEVQGPGTRRRGALTVVREQFRSIHATIPRLQVEERVPLWNDPGKSVGYKHLLKLEERGDYEYWPDGAEEPYMIHELLNGVTDAIQRSKDRGSGEAKRHTSIYGDVSHSVINVGDDSEVVHSRTGYPKGGQNTKR